MDCWAFCNFGLSYESGARSHAFFENYENLQFDTIIINQFEQLTSFFYVSLKTVHFEWSWNQIPS